jgi:hypothetical protein
MLRTRHAAAVRAPDDVSRNLNAIAGPGWLPACDDGPYDHWYLGPTMLGDVRQGHSALWSDVATEHVLAGVTGRLGWCGAPIAPAQFGSMPLAGSPLKPRASGDALGCCARAQCLPAVLHKRTCRCLCPCPHALCESARCLTWQLRIARSAALCVRPHEAATTPGAGCPAALCA